MNRHVRQMILRVVWVVVSLSLIPLFANSSSGQSDPAAQNFPFDLRVMSTGLGSGTVASTTPGINCGVDCDETYASAVAVTLMPTPAAGSSFVGWRGDCTGAGACVVTMNAARSVRAEFGLAAAAPEITNFTPEGIGVYLAANPDVNSPARFLAALPREYRQNWVLMTRSESLQTGVAEFPRVLLPSANAQFVFSLGLVPHGSYPGSHPNAVEYMQWDAAEKNFRFHEIVLDAIPAMGTVPARSRGISADDVRCSRCHSTRNVLNRGATPGTDGIPPGSVKVKNKPNWDTYDSWGGMLPFNRDRIYQGSVEAAAFRRLFNPWTWRSNDAVRMIMEQLELQPPGVPAAHVITRIDGGANDGHVTFVFDGVGPVLTEPAPSGSAPAITTNYSFDRVAGTGAATSVVRGGSFVTLHHSDTPTSDEGRGVQLFDLLGGLDGNLNQQRIADELINHRFATSDVPTFPIEVRPIALAIVKGCLAINAAGNTVTSAAGLPALTVDLGFFNGRHGMSINDLVNDTRTRAESVPRRKADIQKINLDRSVDPYLLLPAAANGLIQQYGAATSAGASTSLERLRQEVFRRPIDNPGPDATVMGGIYVDRELYSFNTARLSLFRYFLEPLGVSVDKWSMGVRGRSRTYSFADVFGGYLGVFQSQLEASLGSSPVAGLAAPFDCTALIPAVNSTLASLPPVNQVPSYTDIQRIFNKGCIECHGGLGYPPFESFGSFLDFSEDEAPPAGDRRMTRSYNMAVAYTTANPATSEIYRRITATNESCAATPATLPPFRQLMPCGGPPLSQSDIETVERWIVGGRPYTEGDPHIQTVDGIHYDFQSAGEFVLLRGEGLEVQARQTAVETQFPLPPNPYTELSTCASLNSAIALRVGPHRITYQPNLSGKPDPSGLQLRIDGKLTELGDQGILLPAGGRIVKTPAPGGIQIEIPGGTVVVITPNFWDYYQVWYMNIDARNVRVSEGVMGALAPGSWLPALPDGTSLGDRPADMHARYDELYETFADAWRVDEDTSLFDYAPGTSTDSFTIDSWPGDTFGQEFPTCTLPPHPGSKPPLEPLTEEAAKVHCSGVVDENRQANCIADVMATGEPGFAETYLRTEQIEGNALPTIPELAEPAHNTQVLTETVRFAWKEATDDDGDPVTYRHCLWGVDELFAFRHCEAPPTQSTEREVELARNQAYFWKVIVEDNKGGMTESEIRRITVPAADVLLPSSFVPFVAQ